MYIKLSFREEEIILPNVWGGLVVGLIAQPQIVDTLPLDVEANKSVNQQLITDNDSSDEESGDDLSDEESNDDLSDSDQENIERKSRFRPKSYDYFYDAGNISLTKAQQAIELFKRNYKLNENYEGLIVFVAGENYPKQNFIIRCLEKALNEARFYQVASLLLNRIEANKPIANQHSQEPPYDRFIKNCSRDPSCFGLKGSRGILDSYPCTWRIPLA